MAIEWVGQGGSSGVFSSTTISATQGSPSPGDLRIVTFVLNGTGSISTPAGWDKPLDVAEAGYRLAVFTRFFQADDGSATFDYGSRYVARTTSVARGVDPVAPFDVAPIQEGFAFGATSYPAGSMTTSADALRVDTSMCGYNSGQATATVAAAVEMVQRGFWRNGTSSVGLPVVLASEARTAAGATGTRTFTCSPANDAAVWNVRFALRTGAPPPPPGAFLPFFA